MLKPTCMPGWITRKVSRILVSQQVSLGTRLHFSKPENTALTVTNPIDSPKETKKPHNKPLNVRYR